MIDVDFLDLMLIVILSGALGTIIGAGLFYTPADFDHPTVDRGEGKLPTK